MKKIKSFFLILIAFFSFNFAPFLKAEESFKYDSKGKRDPFVPLIGPDGEYFVSFSEIKSIADVKLEGIIWDPEGESLVIINGKVIKEGENLDGVRIEKIYSKKVIVLLGGQSFTLDLVEEEVR